MTLLKNLYKKYGDIPRTHITLQQLEELRDNLKIVDAGEITSSKDAQDFLSLLRKFRESVSEADKLHGANYPQLLNSLLSVGEDGLYSNNLRFIFELIQNVDDCEFLNPNDHILDIHFDFNNDRIILRYNEKGFTPFNVFAITGIAEAAKNVSSGKNEIGEKGIGFKSVFGVTNTVLIRSGWFSFELHKENFTIPVANYKNNEYCEGTEMTLFVPGGKARLIYDEIKKQYCNKDALFSKNPLLFLNKLTSLKMYYDGFRTMEFHVTRSENESNSTFYKEENIHLSVNLHDYQNGIERNVVDEICCARYSYEVLFSQEACKSRYGYNTKVGSNGGKKMVLQAVFPYTEYLDSIGNGALYSFLPTQLKFNVPIVCHVPFKLDASREFVDPQEENLWFKDACGYLSELLDYAYKDWARYVKNDIVFYLPTQYRSIFADNNGKEKCLSGQSCFRGDHFTELPIFYTVNGNFVNRGKVFCFDNAEGIVEPERAYRLFLFPKELFLLPESKVAAAFGVYTEKNMYQRLFNFALSTPDMTQDILQYLSDVGFNPTEDNIPTEPFELKIGQVELLLRYPSFSRLFSAYAKKCIQTSNKALVYNIKTDDILSIQDALYPEFKSSEAPRQLEKYLTRCKEQCLLLDIEEEKYFPCDNVLVLSKRNPMTSFSALCYAIDNKDTFSIRMKHKEISERLNLLSESNEGTAEDYLRELRNNRLLGKEAIGNRQYQNYIDLILKAGTDHTRFVQELLQNADDCEYADGVIPQFNLVQSSNEIVTQYNELGFTRGNIRSITAIGESTKNHLLNQNVSQIGEKGVGFKTIFAVADSVRVHSGQYHFVLHSKAPTIPEPLEKNLEDIQGTKMEISIKKGARLAHFNEKEILELCLCLRKLRKIQIDNISINIEDTDNIRTLTINKRKYVFKRFTHTFSVDDETLQERENGLRSISKVQNIVCYVPDRSAGDYPLYCGLPTKHRIKMPIVIDAPFMLTTSREEIDSGSYRWNNKIRSEMYATILSVIEQLKHEERHKVLRFLKFLPQRQGNQTVYANGVSDCEYLNRYDFLTDVRNANILPTFDKNVFVSATSRAAFRYPEAVNYLFSINCFGAIEAKAALDIPEDDLYTPNINALNCPQASFEKIIPLLREYADRHVKEDSFREKLYLCLQNAPEQYHEEFKKLSIIPVYSKSGDRTEYIEWKDDVVFVKKDCTKSEHNYYILNESQLSKSICERIFNVDINKMDMEWERSRYNDGLREIVRGTNIVATYNYLLSEYFKDSFTKYQSKEILKGMRDIIPLKNQLGEIVDNELFICTEVSGYFQSNIILAVSVHDECKGLAEYLGCSSLESIHYQDLHHIESLTGDDIDDLSADYFVNGEEILRSFYRDGKLSEDLIGKYGLGYIALQYSQEDDDLEFPEKPVRNLEKLKSHIRSELENPIKIITVKVERTVHKGQDSYGRVFGLDDKNIRNRTLEIYTPDGAHGRCFCQMCRKVKPYDLMEVNNILAEPKYYFAQTRVALCLECSKLFEAIRLSNAQKSKLGEENGFITAIKKAKIGVGGCVDIPIGKEKIRFTATHLAEVQELLRSMPK